MIYVALLRGINVGGNRKVEMPRLKLLFERLGFQHVRTFINSGNVIFSSHTASQSAMTETIEEAINDEFGFAVDVLLRDMSSVRTVVEGIPESWVNDETMKCDIMFLWPQLDKPETLRQIPFNTEIEDSRYLPGAIIWRINRDNLGKSHVIKIVGSKFHQQMTVRNPNSVRKIYQLMLTADKV